MLRLIPTELCVHHAVNQKKVEKYKKAINNGDIFPPIEVVEHKGKYYVLDGAHRTSAHADGEVLAFVYDYDDCPKLYLLGSRTPRG